MNSINETCTNTISMDQWTLRNKKRVIHSFVRLILCTRNNPVTEDTIDLFFLKNKRIKSNNNYLDKENNGNRDRTKKFGFIGPYLG